MAVTGSSSSVVGGVASESRVVRKGVEGDVVVAMPGPAYRRDEKVWACEGERGAVVGMYAVVVELPGRDVAVGGGGIRASSIRRTERMRLR